MLSWPWITSHTELFFFSFNIRPLDPRVKVAAREWGLYVEVAILVRATRRAHLTLGTLQGKGDSLHLYMCLSTQRNLCLQEKV